MNTREVACLSAAIERGGVGTCRVGNDRYEVFREVVEQLTLPITIDRERLFDAFMERDQAGGTAIGGGIAIPHPRYPAILRGIAPQIRTCYLNSRLDYHARDRQPIETLLVMLCPSVPEHLQLLSILARLLQRRELRGLLAARAPMEQLLPAVRRAELELAASQTASLPTHDPCPKEWSLTR